MLGVVATASSVVSKKPSCHGLSSEQALSSRARAGYNEVPNPSRNLLWSFTKRFNGPIPWLLEACAVITGVLHSFDNMGLILSLLLINAVVGSLEQNGAEAAVDALKVRLAAVVRTLRDEVWAELPSRELVPDDIIRLRAGDVVPADATLLDGSLEIDISALTGESAATALGQGDTALAGAICRHGEARCIVVRTGSATSLGKTVSLVSSASPPSRASAILGKATIVMFSVAVVCAVAILCAAALRGMSLLSASPLVILVLVSCIPSALPTFFTVTSGES